MRATINFNGNVIDLEGTPDEIASMIEKLFGGYISVPVNPIPYRPYIPTLPDPVWINVIATNGGD